MENNLAHVQSSDSTVVNTIVGQLKSQGIFDEFRRDCIADFDTKPAYQNLRQRVEIYVSKFLSEQTWCTDLNKNQVRDNLRRSINESGMLAWGMDHLVEQVVTPKIYQVFYPKIETIVKDYLGLNKIQLEPVPPPPPLPPPLPPENVDGDKQPEMKPPEPQEEPKINENGASYNDTNSSVKIEDINPVVAIEKTSLLGNELTNECKLEEISTENKDGNVENMALDIKVDQTDSLFITTKDITDCKKIEENKVIVEKKTEQDCQILLEKSKSLKDKDKEIKTKRDRTLSECSDKEIPKNLNDKKDQQLKIENSKKSVSQLIKTEKDKRLDKHKIGEKLKPESLKTKDSKKYDIEKTDKKKSIEVKSNLDSAKIKSTKPQEVYGKSHKNEGSVSKFKSSHSKDTKLHKSDTKYKLESNVRSPKTEKINKIDKSEKSKIKAELKVKTDSEKIKSPLSESRTKLPCEKVTKHSSENKSKHTDSKAKYHSKYEVKPSKNIELKQSEDGKNNTSKLDLVDKQKTYDKKNTDKLKSVERSDDKIDYCLENKKPKLECKTVSNVKKSELNKEQLHNKFLEKRKKKVTTNKDDKDYEIQKKLKLQKIKSKIDREKILEKKNLDKKNKSEKVQETTTRKGEKKIDKVKDKNVSKSKSEGQSSKPVKLTSTKPECDIKSKFSDSNKTSRHSSDSKECETESTCMSTFSPDVSSEAESRSSKENDISETARPILGISPSQEESSSEDIFEDFNLEKQKIEICNKLEEQDEFQQIKEDIMNLHSVDNDKNLSKSSQDGLHDQAGDDEEEGAWSDVTISSVHTSDLSSFDDRISLSSSEEVEIPPKDDIAHREKKKVPLKEIKKLTKSHDSDDKENSEVFISEDDKTKESIDDDKKNANLQKSDDCTACDQSQELSPENSKEDNLSCKPKTEHKWELRRQRKINPRYASDEFSSIFNNSKWSCSSSSSSDSDSSNQSEKCSSDKDSNQISDSSENNDNEEITGITSKKRKRKHSKSSEAEHKHKKIKETQNELIEVEAEKKDTFSRRTRSKSLDTNVVGDGLSSIPPCDESETSIANDSKTKIDETYTFADNLKESRNSKKESAKQEPHEKIDVTEMQIFTRNGKRQRDPSPTLSKRKRT